MHFQGTIHGFFIYIFLYHPDLVLLRLRGKRAYALELPCFPFSEWGRGRDLAPYEVPFPPPFSEFYRN